MTAYAATRRQTSLSIVGLDGLFFAGLFVLFAASGFVMHEPAPYDVALLGLMFAAFAGGIRVPRLAGPLFVLIALVAAGDAVGSAMATDSAFATKHSLVTLYLSASAILFACVAASRPERTMRVLVPGMTIAGIATGVAGIAGVLGVHPAAVELFTEYDRAKGMFKDPNVMAPFVILPLLFGIHRLMTQPLARAWPWLAVVGVLTLAVFLSFSRGAWVHLAVSGALYLGFYILTAPTLAQRARAIVVAGVAMVVVIAALAAAFSSGKVRDLFEERAALVHSYDTGDRGRFAGQGKALVLAAENPLGLGAGDFSEYHGEDVHNVYINAFVNGGWLGGFAYLFLIGATIWVGLGGILTRSPAQQHLLPVFACFLGLALEGVIVDTDHWRHFYLVTGLVWGLTAAGQKALKTV